MDPLQPTVPLTATTSPVLSQRQSCDSLAARADGGDATAHWPSRILLAGHGFNIVGPLTLARSGNGFFEYQPHTRYQRYGVEPLNPYGLGPFCKFKVDGLPAGPGLYVFVVDGVPVYVGKTVNFKGRMGPVNYGLISPKNCYRTGQSTNCKINSRVLEAVKAGRYVAVYVHQTSNLDLEDVVIGTVQPRWNGRHGSR
jgi:hypothetical protein